MGNAEYKVIDPKGILYPSLGFNGGSVSVFPKGAVIRKSDADKGYIAWGALEALEKVGRVEKISDGVESADEIEKTNKRNGGLKGSNKQEPKGDNRMAPEEETKEEQNA